MKENPYDNTEFFEQYKNFPRSVEGLTAAGEWHELRQLFPPLNGVRMLDLGCGFGWHCIYAAENGAEKVVGTDISEKMLTVAREKLSHPKIEYLKLPMEDLNFTPSSFDFVFSSLALHYLSDFQMLVKKVYSFLAPNGVFLFSVEHPIFTAKAPQAWIIDTEGHKLYWPVDDYFLSGKREMIFLNEPVIKYHRTLAEYLSPLLREGFTITDISEPQPTPEMIIAFPEMRHEERRPMMLIIKAQKA